MKVPLPSGRDGMYHQCRVTITPHRGATQVSVSVKDFHDDASPFRNYYEPINVEFKPNGREQLRLNVKKAGPADLRAGGRVKLGKGIVVPAGGYLVIVRNRGRLRDHSA